MDTNTILEVLARPIVPAWVALLVVMTPILVTAWYIGSHREEKPRRKRNYRRTRSVAKKPSYEPDDGPLTTSDIRAIKRLVPQGRGRMVSSLFPDKPTKAGRRK